ncbi:MAG: hypothetical protein R2712_11050 [Vicinamibacterales bacterium]
MPVEIDTRDAPRLLRCTHRGPWPRIEDQTTLRTQLLEGGHITPATRVLVDLTALDTLPGLTDLQSTVASAKAHGALPRAIAIVVSRPERCRVGRMIQAALPDSVQATVSRDAEAALRWLESLPVGTLCRVRCAVF